MRTPEQFALSLSRVPRYAAADFCEAPSNAEACAWLSRKTEWPNLRLALWGEAGCGKTHLLYVWAERIGAAVRSAADLSGLPDLPLAGVAVDDADVVAEEAALLHLLNAAAEAKRPVLLAARAPPARWPVRLPDLASRLRASIAVEIGPPDDMLLRVLLARLLAERQLRLPNLVQEWLVRRLPRSAAALRDAVERRDALALAQHRNITVPFAAQALADVLAPDDVSGTRDDPSRISKALG